MRISSRTPDGTPITCPTCGQRSIVLVSTPLGDTVCPVCGGHLWVGHTAVSRRPAELGRKHRANRQSRSRRRKLIVDHTLLSDATFPVRILRHYLQRARHPSLWDRAIRWLTKQPDRTNDPWAAQVCGIIDAMTEPERSSPGMIDGSRIRRIAAGSGVPRCSVCELLQLLVDLHQDT